MNNGFPKCHLAGLSVIGRQRRLVENEAGVWSSRSSPRYSRFFFFLLIKCRLWRRCSHFWRKVICRLLQTHTHQLFSHLLLFPLPAFSDCVLIFLALHLLRLCLAKNLLVTFCDSVCVLSRLSDPPTPTILIVVMIIKLIKCHQTGRLLLSEMQKKQSNCGIQ